MWGPKVVRSCIVMPLQKHKSSRETHRQWDWQRDRQGQRQRQRQRLEIQFNFLAHETPPMSRHCQLLAPPHTTAQHRTPPLNPNYSYYLTRAEPAILLPYLPLSFPFHGSTSLSPVTFPLPALCSLPRNGSMQFSSVNIMLNWDNLLPDIRIATECRSKETECGE